MIKMPRRRKADPVAANDFNAKKIDLITQEPGGTCRLYILQDEPWTETDDEIATLREKIENYAAFVMSGQLTTRYPQLAGQPWRIVVDTYTGAPGDATLHALREAGTTLATHGA